MKRSTIRTIASGAAGFCTLGVPRLMGFPKYAPRFEWIGIIDLLVLFTFVVSFGYLMFGPGGFLRTPNDETTNQP